MPSSTFSSFAATTPLIDSLPLWTTLIQLIFRVLTVCFFAAKINENSSKTTAIINTVPVENGVAEIKHFQDFLANTKVFLTGMGLFSLTKGLILTVSSKSFFLNRFISQLFLNYSPSLQAPS